MSSVEMIDYSWDFRVEEFSLDLDFFNEKDQEDRMWQARTGLTYETLCGAVETIIFMSDRPVTLQKIKNSIDTDLPLRVVHESLAKLQAEYEEKHHGIRLMEVAQGYQFRTKATYAALVQKLFKVSSLQLSPTALEVLAIIAYKQPLSKTDVENVRGVDSSHIIRSLMDKRLVRITGRSEEMGRPSLYGTTAEFLEVFNLAKIEDLPSEHELEELATTSNVASISEIKDVVRKGDKSRFNFDEIDELDELSQNIKQIKVETNFTSELKQDKKNQEVEASAPRRSAFDILEEYLVRSELVKANSLASESVFSGLEQQASVLSLDIFGSEVHNPPLAEEETEQDLEDAPLFDYDDPEVFDIDSAKELLLEELDSSFEKLFSEEDDQKDRENAELIQNKLSDLADELDDFVTQANNLDLNVDFLKD